MTIERARELRGLAAGGHDLFAAREAIGVARCGQRALAPRVERECRVHVGIAEERLAQRVVARARLARLGARKRQLACVCAERDECEAGGDCSQPNTPNRFAVGWRPNGVS